MRWTSLGRAALGAVLLIGLPVLLYALLTLTQNHYGGWPAVAGTLSIALVLSVSVHHTRRGERSE